MQQIFYRFKDELYADYQVIWHEAKLQGVTEDVLARWDIPAQLEVSSTDRLFPVSGRRTLWLS